MNHERLIPESHLVMAKQQKLSLDELESLLKDRKHRIDELKKKQSALQRDLDRVSTEIAMIEGKSAKRTTKGKKKTVRRKRAKNRKALKEYVTDILQEARNGLTLAELHDRVLAAGYKSHSKSFKNVLYQCLYHGDEFLHDAETGIYTLKPLTKPEPKKKVPVARKK